MRLEVVPRGERSRWWSYGSPILAIALTLLTTLVIFAVLGKDPLESLRVMWIDPLTAKRGLSELFVKGAPIIMIAVGLSLGFRANVWNIGAEGQYIMGCIAASGVALMANENTSHWFVVPVVLAGVLGGMFWAGITAFLRDRFNANEILVSLMLVYVSVQVLNYMVSVPWKDPDGYNFPQTKLFELAASVPFLIENTRVTVGLAVALLCAGVLWVFLFRTRSGFALQVGGLAPAASLYAGFSSRSALWTALMISGGLAGMAGALEVAGPIGQLNSFVPAGYGFAAIIVAFVGRLHPGGLVLSSVLMSMFYIGGELAQTRMGLPKALTGVFQGLLLFSLLGCDTLVNYRLRLIIKGGNQ